MNNPDSHAERAETEGTPEVIRFWRSPVRGKKFSNVPVFLPPVLAQMATEVPDTLTGRRI